MNDHDLALVRRLALARLPKLGARGAASLIERAGSVEALFAVDHETLLGWGVPRAIAASLARPSRWLERAQAELDELRAAALTGLGRGLRGYPESLLGIHDPPLFLACAGTLLPDDARAIAVVGARRATPGGRELAHQLGAELAQAGVTVVSGLARGIDRAAHEGALAAGGRTLAVLGSGLLRVHPPQHRPLARRIARAGAVLSELEPRQDPAKWTFPQRNRVVAGLSQGVVVVQAGARSGALITAELALQSGREVLAVPGSVFDPLARGTNRLIKDGAHLVETARDVLDVVFGVEPEPEAGPAHAPEGTPEARLLGALPGTLDELAQRSGLAFDVLLPTLGRLQLEARVRSTPTGFAAA
jgi:DNA processing protein